MDIQIDSREKSRAIKQILKDFDAAGVHYFISKLYVGDYMNLDNPRIIIDRKQNLLEVSSNVCQDHERFRSEMVRAEESGIEMIILVEHGDGIKSLEDVKHWQNPRCKSSPKALSGERLAKIMQTMSEKYNCKWLFCDKSETGKLIVALLDRWDI